MLDIIGSTQKVHSALSGLKNLSHTRITLFAVVILFAFSCSNVNDPTSTPDQVVPEERTQCDCIDNFENITTNSLIVDSDLDSQKLNKLVGCELINDVGEGRAIGKIELGNTDKDILLIGLNDGGESASLYSIIICDKGNLQESLLLSEVHEYENLQSTLSSELKIVDDSIFIINIMSSRGMLERNTGYIEDSTSYRLRKRFYAIGANGVIKLKSEKDSIWVLGSKFREG